MYPKHKKEEKNYTRHIKIKSLITSNKEDNLRSCQRPQYWAQRNTGKCDHRRLLRNTDAEDTVSRILKALKEKA